MSRSLLIAVLASVLVVARSASPDPAGAQDKVPAKPRLTIASVELADGLRTRFSASTLTDLLVKHAKRSSAFSEVELAGEQIQQLAREAREDLRLGRIPPNLKVEKAAPAAPELLLVATASRDGEVSVMTARLVDRVNLKIVRVAEVRGRGKAGDFLDFPADLVAQATDSKGGGRLSVSLQMHADVSGPFYVLRPSNVPLQNAKLKFVKEFSGVELSADPKPAKMSQTTKGWELDWELKERTEIKITINRKANHRFEPDVSDEKGPIPVLIYSYGGKNVKATHSIVVSPWQQKEVRIDAEKLGVLGP